MLHERLNRLTNIDLLSVPQVGYSGVDLWCECLMEAFLVIMFDGCLSRMEECSFPKLG
jgi:hypothetical protein